MTDEQVAGIVSAIQRIAHGTMDGPTGLELVAMALSGKHGNVAESLDRIATAIENHAYAVGQLAGVLDHHGSRRV